MISAGLFVNISKDLTILEGYSKIHPALICEYKNDPFILNGAAISLISLIEYYSYAGRNNSKRTNVKTAAVKKRRKRFTIDRVRNYIDGIEILVRMSNSFLWSFYDCKRKIPANRYYHSLHIELLRFLYDYTGRRIFKTYRMKFIIGKYLILPKLISFFIYSIRKIFRSERFKNH